MRVKFLVAIIVFASISQWNFAQYSPTFLLTSSSANAYSSIQGTVNNEGEVALGNTVWLPRADHSYSAGFNTIALPSGWNSDGWIGATNDHLDIVGGAAPPNPGPGESDYVVAEFGDSFTGYSAGFNALYGPTTPIVLGINNLHQIMLTDDWGWHIWLPSADYGLPAGRSVLSGQGIESSINNSGQIVGGYYGSNPTLAPAIKPKSGCLLQPSD